ncbi:DUF5050 domain-containing protein [Clostridium sp. MB40-C1]|uniref:DUF5050 domain-containing protein n=1 Tax=Clostridium sp. MB40-C1 TaxID=3070996 RepID=UPI0027E0F15D|nr:DUF5050 domain-containing protein [Clostridium sp. MB40-C1]WMJ80047.1 DUF5050 domain-containing protein [Clostridium sp. MB40-C1]
MRKIKLLSVCILFLLTLIGCQDKILKSCNSTIYNSSINDSFVDGGKYIYGSVSNNSIGFTSIIKDKSTGKIETFIRDPFFDENKKSTYVEQIHIDNKNNKGYYLDTSSINNETGFSIVEFDFDTFKKKNIYSEKYILGKRVFLGLNEISDVKVHKENDFSKNEVASLGDFSSQIKYFIGKDCIYIIRQNGIFKVNIKNKKQTKLINEYDIKCVSFDGEYIYYINNTYDLYRYSIKTSEKIKLTSNKSSYLIITENKIIYTNLNDKNGIYIMSKDGSNEHKISNNSADKLNYDNKYIYYSNVDDNQCLYRIKYDGSENKKMTNNPAYFIFTFKNYDKIYIWADDRESGSIKEFSVDKKDFHIEALKF